MYEPLAELQVQGDAILLPGHAWSEQLLPLLMDVAASSSYGDELPMVETDGELQSSRTLLQAAATPCVAARRRRWRCRLARFMPTHADAWLVRLASAYLPQCFSKR